MNNENENENDNDKTCPVCYCEWNDNKGDPQRKIVTLCIHSFCLKCLVQLRDNTRARARDKLSFPCPMCEFPLPSSWLSGLVGNKPVRWDILEADLKHLWQESPPASWTREVIDRFLKKRSYVKIGDEIPVSVHGDGSGGGEREREEEKYVMNEDVEYMNSEEFFMTNFHQRGSHRRGLEVETSRRPDSFPRRGLGKDIRTSHVETSRPSSSSSTGSMEISTRNDFEDVPSSSSLVMKPFLKPSTRRIPRKFKPVHESSSSEISWRPTCRPSWGPAWGNPSNKYTNSFYPSSPKLSCSLSSFSPLPPPPPPYVIPLAPAPALTPVPSFTPAPVVVSPAWYFRPSSPVLLY